MAVPSTGSYSKARIRSEYSYDSKPQYSNVTESTAMANIPDTPTPLISADDTDRIDVLLTQSGRRAPPIRGPRLGTQFDGVSTPQ
jgi:hypothetical protein